MKEQQLNHEKVLFAYLAAIRSQDKPPALAEAGPKWQNSLPFEQRARPNEEGSDPAESLTWFGGGWSLSSPIPLQRMAGVRG